MPRSRARQQRQSFSLPSVPKFGNTIRHPSTAKPTATVKTNALKEVDERVAELIKVSEQQVSLAATPKPAQPIHASARLTLQSTKRNGKQHRRYSSGSMKTYPYKPPSYIIPELGLSEHTAIDQLHATKKHSSISEIVRALKGSFQVPVSLAAMQRDVAAAAVSVAGYANENAETGSSAVPSAPASILEHVSRQQRRHPRRIQSLPSSMRLNSAEWRQLSSDRRSKTTLPPVVRESEFETALRLVDGLYATGSFVQSQDANPPSLSDLPEASPLLMQRSSWRKFPIYSNELLGHSEDASFDPLRTSINSKWLEEEMAAVRDAHASEMHEDANLKAKYTQEMAALGVELLAFSIVSRAVENGIKEFMDHQSKSESERQASERRRKAAWAADQRDRVQQKRERLVKERIVISMAERRGSKTNRFMRAAKMQQEIDKMAAREEAFRLKEEEMRKGELFRRVSSTAHGMLKAAQKWRKHSAASILQKKHKAKQERIRARMAALQAQYAADEADAHARAELHVAGIREKRERAERAEQEYKEGRIRIFREACDLKDKAYFGDLKDEVIVDAGFDMKSKKGRHKARVSGAEAFQKRQSVVAQARAELAGQTKETARAKRGFSEKVMLFEEPEEMDPRGFFLHTIEHHEPDSCTQLSADETHYLQLSKQRLKKGLAEEKIFQAQGWVRPHFLLVADKWETDPGYNMSNETHDMFEDACLHHHSDGEPVVHINYPWDITPTQLLGRIHAALKGEAHRQGLDRPGRIRSLAMMVTHSEGSVFMTKKQLTSISSLSLMTDNPKHKEDQAFWVEIDHLLTVCQDPSVDAEPDRRDVDVHLIGHQFDFNRSKNGRGLQTLLSAMFQCEVTEVNIPYDQRVTGIYFDVSKVAKALEAYDYEKRCHRGLVFEESPHGAINMLDL